MPAKSLRQMWPTTADYSTMQRLLLSCGGGEVFFNNFSKEILNLLSKLLLLKNEDEKELAFFFISDEYNRSPKDYGTELYMLVLIILKIIT